MNFWRNEEYGLKKKDLVIISDAVKGKVRRKEREETAVSKAPIVEMETLSDGEKRQIEEDTQKKKNYSVAKSGERKRRRVRWREQRRKRNDERRGKKE